MATLNTRLTASIDVSFVGDHEFGGPIFNQSIRQVLDFTTGTGADQADIMWMDERTVASGATDSIDLTSSLKNPDGVQKILVRPTALLIINAPRNSSTPNTTGLTVGGVAANTYAGFFSPATGGLISIQPGGGALLWNRGAASYATITDVTNDILAIVNSAGASNTYQIAILGRTA